jgi:hypothetical protein
LRFTLGLTTKSPHPRLDHPAPRFKRQFRHCRRAKSRSSDSGGKAACAQDDGGKKGTSLAPLEASCATAVDSSAMAVKN